MGPGTRRLLSLGTGGILVWTALVAVPPLALAGSQPRRGALPARDSTVTAPVSDDMVTACQTHCALTTAALDTLITQVQTAQAAHDPAQMRAALEQAQQPLAAMQDHLTLCTNMMRMMQQMHGGMGGAKPGT